MQVCQTCKFGPLCVSLYIRAVGQVNPKGDSLNVSLLESKAEHAAVLYCEKLDKAYRMDQSEFVESFGVPCDKFG